jgi:hypothetical protein
MPSRVEREIEEILNRMDSDPSGRRPLRLRRSWRSRIKQFFSRIPRPHINLSRLNPGTLMLAGMGLILSSIILRSVAPDLVRFVVIAGLVLFFGSFILAFRRKDTGTLSSGETYWRGQRYARTELGGPSTLDRLRSWWRNRNRRRW